MQVNLRVRHARMLVEKLKEQVELQQAQGKNLKYLASAQITLPKGLVTDSEMKSFLAALDAALAKFDMEEVCQLQLYGDVIAPEQVEIEQALQQSFGRAMQLEQDLLKGPGRRTK